jgi:hypothetical protein
MVLKLEDKQQLMPSHNQKLGLTLDSFQVWMVFLNKLIQLTTTLMVLDTVPLPMIFRSNRMLNKPKDKILLVFKDKLIPGEMDSLQVHQFH